jgi:hypothetical protein
VVLADGRGSVSVLEKPGGLLLSEIRDGASVDPRLIAAFRRPAPTRSPFEVVGSRR